MDMEAVEAKPTKVEEAAIAAVGALGMSQQAQPRFRTWLTQVQHKAATT